MYTIGILTGQEVTLSANHKTQIPTGRKTYQAILYKATQAQKGHWYWKRTKYQTDKIVTWEAAKPILRDFMDQWGTCRVHLYPLGNQRIN